MLLPFLDDKFAFIVLNSPIGSASVPLFKYLWETAELCVCADGGANRVYDSVLPDNQPYIPHCVIGDMDSIRPDVKTYYQSAGAKIEYIDDQYSTDLDKAINLTHSHGLQNNIVIFGGMSGRVDQTIGVLATLHKCQLELPQRKMWVISDQSLTCTLTAGTHTLDVSSRLLGPTCGILPVGIDNAMISTKGLRWDLDNAVTSFNGMISTSNHLADSVVEITTDKPLLWTCELAASLTSHEQF